MFQLRALNTKCQECGSNGKNNLAHHEVYLLVSISFQLLKFNIEGSRPIL